jgi:multicomponent Na+:H+ antiporter subunit A
MGAIRPDTIVLNWLLALPFFAALCAEIFPRLSLGAHAEREAEALRRGPFLLGALASLMGVGLGISLIPQTLGGSPVAVDYWWTRDLYHLRFQADVLTAPVLVLLCAMGLLIHLYLAGLPLLPQPHHRAALVLAAQGCVVASCLSADLILMCFTMQLALICLWLLVYLDSPRAANTLLSVTYIGGAILLAGVLVMWNRVGDSSTSPLPMLLVPVEPHHLQWMSLLVLVGVLPLIACFPSSGWLLGVAEGSPALALAPGLLLPVAGMCIALRLIPGSVTLGLLPGLGAVGLILGAATLCWGALRAWLTISLRNVAAWLTVSQAGLFLIAIGAAASPTASPGLLQAGALHTLAAPAALLGVWLAAGAIRCRFGTDSIPDLAGVIGKAPLAGFALLVGGLSLAGLPPLPGFQMQRLLISGLLRDHQTWLAVVVLAADVIVAVAVLDTLRRLVSGTAVAAPRWSSPWLSVALIVVSIALVAAVGASAQLGNWSDLALRGALSISRSGISLPR